MEILHHNQLVNKSGGRKYVKVRGKNCLAFEGTMDDGDTHILEGGGGPPYQIVKIEERSEPGVQFDPVIDG